MQEKSKGDTSAPGKKKDIKGKVKEVSFTERPIVVSQLKKELKVGDLAWTAEEKDMYVPGWDIKTNVTLGEPGLPMNFFHHYFPPGLKKEMEKIPIDVGMCIGSILR